MAATNLSKVSVLRTILRSIRQNRPESGQVQHNPSFMYIMEQYRKNATTDAQYCQEHQEMAFLAETYATYLESSVKYRELYDEFHHPERTVEETARMVGFKLPYDDK